MGKKERAVLDIELGEGLSIQVNAYKGKLSLWLSSGYRKGISLQLEGVESLINGLYQNIDKIVEGYDEAKGMLDDGWEISFGKASKSEKSKPESKPVSSGPRLVSLVDIKSKAQPPKPQPPKAEPPKESLQDRISLMKAAQAAMQA